MATAVETRPAASAPAAWRRSPLLPLLPILAFLAVLFLYPVLQLLGLSVLDREGAFTLEHYRRLATASVYFDVMVITFKISGWTTLLCVLGGYPIAYLLATTNERTRNSLALWVLMPFWTSFLVRTFAWMILLGQKGAINQLLLALGIADAPLALIYNLTGVLIGMVHALMPLAVLTMVSVMQNIPANLPQAASTLGARGGQAFWRIYFPLSLPGVAAAGLMVFITALGFFITPALLGGRRETMIAQVIITQVQELLNWSFAGALALVLLASALVVFYLYDRILGMSTLSGGSAAGADAAAPSGWLGRVGGRIGWAAMGALGWICDRVGATWERLTAMRADRPRRPMARWVLRVSVLITLVFLTLPSLFVIPVSFTAGRFVEFPPQGFSLQWYAEYLGSPTWVEATIRSLLVGIATAVLAMAIGTAAAFVLVRQSFFGKTAVLAFILSPLIIPRMVVAVALFYLYARIGLVGTSLGLVLGHTVLALPYVVITIMAVLKTYDERYDQAAWSLGANRWRTLVHVTFPLIRGGLIAAFLFAFITSFDELTIALFVSGGLISTLPRQMWNDLLLQVNPTLAAVSTVMLLLITMIILAAEAFRRRAVRG